MKACLFSGVEQMEVKEVDRPARAENEVTIEVARAGLCGTDLHVYLGDMAHRVTPPRILGHEMVGAIVEAPEEGDFREGDRVVVEPTVFCGRCAACRRGHTHVCQNLNFMGVDSTGAFANYWNVPQDRLHKVPDTLDDVAGALIEPLAVAVHDVRRAQVEVGDRAVVIGGGPIGLLVAIAARLDGADVIISEVNPFRIGVAESCGFDTVNPSETNLVDHVNEWTDGAAADLVFEVSGHPAGAEVMTEIVRVRGTIALVGVHAEPVPVNLQQFFARELHLTGCRVYESIDFERAIRIAEADHVPVDKIVTNVTPMEEIGWGFEQMKNGRDVMKVMIDCQS
ncbi:MAG: Zn-dependent alcohol dehydrogenase [Gemmatimonadetes bacterium]|nr:Zn-dependent alcohol dehydrogenase [Gemmatimonadota bacterium]